MEKLLNDSSPDDSLLGPAAVPLGTEGSAGIRLDENEKIMLENIKMQLLQKGILGQLIVILLCRVPLKMKFLLWMQKS